MELRRSSMLAIAAGALVAVLGGCQKEGAGERAGKAVDKAVDNAGKQMEKAGEALRDAAKKENKK